MNMIEVENLKKNFKTRKGLIKAVNGIQFNVIKGEVFGLLGPNGAGKTTTMRIIATLIKPDSGIVKINGLNIEENSLEVRSNFAYMPQEPKLFPFFTVSEHIKMYLSFYGFDTSECTEKCQHILRDLSLKKHSRKKPPQLSTGLKRRIQLARVLACKPPLIFLDEPTTGLDVQAQIETWEYIKSMVSEKEITVFLTTHIMKEVKSCVIVLLLWTMVH